MNKTTEHKVESKKSSKHSRELSKLKIRFIEYYSKLPIQKLAAGFIGKDQTTIIRWKNNDKNFANQIASTKSAWALENARQVKSKEWLLERILREEFGESIKVDVDISEGVEEALDYFKTLKRNV